MPTREEKLKILAKLDPKLQEMIFSDSATDILDKIRKEYDLTEEKISATANIISDIFLGILPLASLPQEINSKIITDAQIAAKLTQELYSEIFAPVIS